MCSMYDITTIAIITITISSMIMDVTIAITIGCCVMIRFEHMAQQECRFCTNRSIKITTNNTYIVVMLING